MGVSNDRTPKEADMPATPLSPDEALMSKEKGNGDIPIQESRIEGEEPQYPQGYNLIFLSLGMMAVVLMVAIDNYILGNHPVPSIFSLPWTKTHL